MPVLPKWATGLVARLIGLALVLLLAFFVLGRVGLKFDPFGWGDRKLEAAQGQAETATQDADARGLEVQGLTAQAARVDAYTHVILDASALQAAASTEAGRAPDAQDPWPVERAARHHAVDERLCALAPRTCASAPAGDATSGPAGVPSGAVAPVPDK